VGTKQGLTHPGPLALPLVCGLDVWVGVCSVGSACAASSPGHRWTTQSQLSANRPFSLGPRLDVGFGHPNHCAELL
jgi:hypothetical protein